MARARKLLLSLTWLCSNSIAKRWLEAGSWLLTSVPRGSIEKGRQFVITAGGKSPACTICHGPGLNGVGPIPGLAHSSPSYIVRQLWDFQHGVRAGPWSPLMAPSVINLTLDDMVAI